MTATKNITVIPARRRIGNAVNKEVKPKLRVAAYCRVSTDSDEQATSYDAQVEHYTNFIQKNEEWAFAGIFADDGISGTNTKKREEFNRMIAECMEGHIDMIITKSISRFARNTLDCLRYIRQLKEKNIPVFFEKENINTMDSKGEVLLTIMASLAQQESESLSKNVKLGMQFRFQKGEVRVNHNRFMGYTKDEDGHLIIEPAGAEIVKRIYREYLQGASLKQIGDGLMKDGILTGAGKPKWRPESVKKILKNEKYIGDALLQKTYTVDVLTKKRVKNNGIVPQYYVENSHEPIIPRDLYMQVQEEMLRRSNLHSGVNRKKRIYSSKYALSELLICAECGNPYKRKTWTNGSEKRIYWRCLNRIEHGAKYCPHSKGFEEKRLHSAICRALKKAVNDNAESLLLIKANLAYAVTGDETNIDLGAIEKRIKEATKEMEEYMVNYRNTGGDKNRYLECIQSAADEIKALRVQLETAKSKLEKCDEANSEIKRLCDWLDCHDTSFADYDDIVIRRVVECIKVYKDGTIKVITKFGTEATETI